MATNGALNTVANIFTAPAEAFRALKEKPTFLLPLLALIALNVVVILWYYSSVDLVWLVETSLDNSGAEIPADQREQMVEQMSSVSPMVMGGGAAVASGFVVLILLLLAAAYFSIVSLMTNDGYKFKYWFSLVCWSSFPVVLALLASMVNLAINDPTFLPAEQLNPLTFANLLALDVTDAGFGTRMLQYTDLTSVWALVLMVLGYRMWTGKPVWSSALIVTAPLLVIIAIALVASS